MKKSLFILAALLCLALLCTAAGAQLPDISSITNTDTSGRNLSTQSLTLESIQLYGEIDPSTQAVLDMLAGATLEYSAQTGESPRYFFELSLPDTEILSYSLQRGTPYYVGSNFLGENIYMINDEDEFEEKLVTAFYSLLEKVSDDTSGLPDLDQILSVIKAIRGGQVQVLPASAMQGLSLTQEINPSAFMPLVGDLMTRIAPADPTAAIAYRYTDFDLTNSAFIWPKVADLPEISASASAMSGTFYGTDLIKFLDCLPQFFNDNPELTDMLNQVIVESLNRSNPEMGIPEGTDVLTELVSSAQESTQGIENYYLTFKIDNSESGSPALITIEIGQPSEGVNQGVRMTLIPAAENPQNALDMALDIFAGEESMPMFRGLFVSNADDESSTLNFLFAPSYDMQFEYLMNSTSTENVFGSRNSDTKFDYVYIGSPDGNISGHGVILSTAESNTFDGEDHSTQISYTHEMNETPVFSVTVTANDKTEEALPALTPDDAVAASGMTAEDYDDLASTVFMQLMELMMNFM